MNVPNRGKYLSLHISDAWKGVITAVLAAALSGLYLELQKDTLPGWIEIRQILISAASAGLANIIKNFLTNSQGQLLKKEPETQLFN